MELEGKIASFKWQRRLTVLADIIATWSKESRKVGAVIATPDMRQISVGYNGLPPQLLDDYSESNRNELCCHAEANAISNAPFDVKGCAIATSFSPCFECAKLIAASQIAAVLTTHWCITDDKTECAKRYRQREAIAFLQSAGIFTLERSD